MTPALASGPIGIPSAYADLCPTREVVFARGTGEPPGVGKVGQVICRLAQIANQWAVVGGLPGQLSCDAGFRRERATTVPTTQVLMSKTWLGAAPTPEWCLAVFLRARASSIWLPRRCRPRRLITSRRSPSSAIQRAHSRVAWRAPLSPPIGPLYNSKTIDLCATDDPACSGGMNVHGARFVCSVRDDISSRDVCRRSAVGLTLSRRRLFRDRLSPSGFGVGRAELGDLERTRVTCGLDGIAQRTGQARERPHIEQQRRQ